MSIKGSVQTGFSPARHGFRFPNRFAPGPVWPHPGWRWGVGDKAAGLCGGMTYAALDCFLAGQPVPAEEVPSAGLLRFLARRQRQSLHLPAVALRYYTRMLPHRQAKLARQTVAVEWPRLRDRLDRGQPCPLALILATGYHPAALTCHHQVLAYAYTLTPEGVDVWIYDPNFPADEIRKVSLNLVTGRLSYMGRPVYNLFCPPYRPVRPVLR